MGTRYRDTSPTSVQTPREPRRYKEEPVAPTTHRLTPRELNTQTAILQTSKKRVLSPTARYSTQVDNPHNKTRAHDTSQHPRRRSRGQWRDGRQSFLPASLLPPLQTPILSHRLPPPGDWRSNLVEEHLLHQETSDRVQGVMAQVTSGLYRLFTDLADSLRPSPTHFRTGVSDNHPLPPHSPYNNEPNRPSASSGPRQTPRQPPSRVSSTAARRPSTHSPTRRSNNGSSSTGPH